MYDVPLSYAVSHDRHRMPGARYTCQTNRSMSGGRYVPYGEPARDSDPREVHCAPVRPSSTGMTTENDEVRGSDGCGGNDGDSDSGGGVGNSGSCERWWSSC